MREFKVIQLSDTHLDPMARKFRDNWETALAYINAAKPDLVVHSGDVNCDDPDNEISQNFACAELNRLSVPWMVIPGNHDIGDGPPDPVFGQTVTSERCTRFCERYGADHWVKDAGAWTLLGINSLILDTGLPEEETQWTWLSETLEKCGNKPIALFLHKPPFLANFEETQNTSSTLSFYGRKRLATLVAKSNVRLIASGHRHEYRYYKGEIPVCWAPSTAFTLDQGTPSPPPNSRQVNGLLEHKFSTSGHSHRLLELPGIAPHNTSAFYELHSQ